jgi:hypothetical protein
VTTIMFFFGLFLGGTLGALAMAMAAATRDSSEYELGYYVGYGDTGTAVTPEQLAAFEKALDGKCPICGNSVTAVTGEAEK